MSWCCGTHSCGHEGKVQLCGKASYKEWRAKQYFSEPCKACKKKEREERAKEIALKYDFPKLSGTEKQVAWANALRAEFLDYCEKWELIADNMILAETDAGFWIDNRNRLRDPGFISRYNRGFIRDFEEKSRDEMLLKEDAIDPQNPLHDGVVEIVDYIEPDGCDHYICISYPKDPDFINIAKSDGFRWSVYKKVWMKDLPKDIGPHFEKEAEEIGRLLLKGGFAVSVHNEKVKQILEDGIGGMKRV